MASTPLVEVDRDETIATLRFNRPDKLNAITLELLQELRDSLVALPESETNGVVITGNGPATCAGMDRDIVSDEEYDEKYKDRVDSLNDDVFDFLNTCPFPTVVAGHGALIGIGFALSLRCDFLVLGEETQISLPEIKYDISSARSLPYLERMIGSRAAKEVVLTGDPVDPQRARELGLVNDVVAEDEVEDAARELVGQIASHDPEVVRELKAAAVVPSED